MPEKNLAVLQELNEKAGHQDLQLEAGITMTARVVDADGQPVTSAQVYVMIQTGNMGFPVSPLPVPVDEDGRARM